MEYKDISPAIQSEEQLRFLVQEKTASGEIDMPSERALETELGVSRTTLRRTLDTLEKEAIVQKRNRKGMVINTKQTINILKMNSMSSQLPGEQIITVVSNEVANGVPEVNQFLGLDLNQPVFKLIRLREVSGRPFSFEISYVDIRRFAGIAAIDFNNRSLYHVLEKEFKTRPTYGREELRFVSADEELSDSLKVPLETPLFEVVSKAFDQNDEPVEYSKQYLIGNQIKYKINAKHIFDYLEDE
ncbi:MULTISPECIES: GntR family transcriptional regulator [Listeria]|uniref:GntR family transcriptional regulator n=1 Tax=Listeria TaxID=1637 RepID=UPI000B593815|nr:MULTISPECIES: GntR family transcriptional regulator [Listeria]